jgi:hypothetical protein
VIRCVIKPIHRCQRAVPLFCDSVEFKQRSLVMLAVAVPADQGAVAMRVIGMATVDGSVTVCDGRGQRVIARWHSHSRAVRSHPARMLLRSDHSTMSSTRSRAGARRGTINFARQAIDVSRDATSCRRSRITDKALLLRSQQATDRIDNVSRRPTRRYGAACGWGDRVVVMDDRSFEQS